MDLFGTMPGGIKCRECNSTVSNQAGLNHLQANGIRYDALYVPFLVAVVGSAALTPAWGKNKSKNKLTLEIKITILLESAFIAEKYNVHEYRCVNNHSGSWIPDV